MWLWLLAGVVVVAVVVVLGTRCVVLSSFVLMSSPRCVTNLAVTGGGVYLD